MDPMQEMLELLRAMRATQLEAIQTQKRIVKKTRLFASIILILVFAYLIWAVWYTSHYR